MVNIDRLKNGLNEYHLSVSENQLNQFCSFYDLLIEWNSFMNLTGITEWNDVVDKHFLDSAAVLKYVTLENHKIIDIGTGAGFPGIPLCILCPDCQFVLMDSLNKRIKFLNEVIDSIGLKNVKTVHARAEDLARQDLYREQFDFVTSRAVANLSTLSEFCIPFLKVNGRFISYKSEKTEEEILQAKKALFLLSSSVENVIDYSILKNDYVRKLVMIKKEKPTSKKYPRKSGLPAKEPL